MQSLKIAAAAGAIALFAATGASAQLITGFHGVAKLAAPVAAPSQTVINGVTWSCEGDTCEGVAPRYTSLDGALRACKQVAAALGPFTSYASQGRVVTGSALRICNSEVSARAGGASSPTAKQ